MDNFFEGPLQKTFLDLTSKMAKQVAENEDEFKRLLEAKPEAMDLYSLKDLGFVIGKLAGTKSDDFIKKQVLELPPIKENELEDVFQDIERCRGLYFLLIYIQSLIKRNEESKLSKLCVANLVSRPSMLITKAALDGKIYFFNFIKEENRTDIKIPDFSELKKYTNLNISPNSFGL